MSKVLLLILDGWGQREEKAYNAIKMAQTPNYEQLIAQYPHSLLAASGLAVGLPEGQVGNSEVGHITIGSGKAILQELPRINQALTSGEFKSNTALLASLKKLKETNSTCHLVGLISDGGVHSHIAQIITLANFIQEQDIKVKLHAIIDGRDVAPKSAKKYLELIDAAQIEIASVSGRFYAMDRDNRWERIEKAFSAISQGGQTKFVNPLQVIEESYAQGISDEFILPHSAQSYHGFQANDAVIFTNFRADRIRQIAASITSPEFNQFKRQLPKLSSTLMMTKYSDQLSQYIETLFPHEAPKETLGEIIAGHGLRQMRIAETEKYAHVTYFFNGGREEQFAGENRILIPSPKVATYDLQPEMSLAKVTEAIIQAMEQRYDLIVANFANADMVGHSGNLEATIKAIEAIDRALGEIIEVLKKSDYEMIITADHGNAEEMMDTKNNQPLTSHSLNPVPIIYYGKKKIELKDGTLADVAPTILKLMSIDKPKTMKGNPLI